MFRFERIGDERGDCTAMYRVILDREYTVKEFVRQVLFRKREWGYIGIRNDANPWFGEPHCEYGWGELLSYLPEEILNRKILSVTSSGGWSRMDYLLTIE